MKTIFGFVIFTKKDMANMNEYIDYIREDNKKLKSELSALKNRPHNAKGQYVKSEVQDEN